LSHLSSLPYSTITVLYILDGQASIMILNNELKRGFKKGVNKTMKVFISETIVLIKIKKEVGGRSNL
jgi:hypothetical protein